jgi:hypothetical protein
MDSHRKPYYYNDYSVPEQKKLPTANLAVIAEKEQQANQ